MYHNEEEYLEFLKNLPSNFRVMPHALQLGLHEEYMQFDIGIVDDLEEVEDLESALYASDSSLEIKKACIIALAHLGKVEALNVLESYLSVVSPELEDWLRLATHECQMYLESDLLDESIVMISGGMGGEEHRMRYFAALIPQAAINESADITHLVRSEFETIAQKRDSVVEWLEVGDGFYKMMLLIPIDVPLDQFMGNGIAEINNTIPDYLHETYMLTNVSIPTSEQLLAFADEVRSDTED